MGEFFFLGEVVFKDVKIRVFSVVWVILNRGEDVIEGWELKKSLEE